LYEAIAFTAAVTERQTVAVAAVPVPTRGAGSYSAVEQSRTADAATEPLPAINQGAEQWIARSPDMVPER
jgi:hypothetical protein